MKKTFVCFFAIALVFAFSGCSKAAERKTTGVIFLDYFEDYDEYSKEIKDSPYCEEYEFLQELSKEEFIDASEGAETFAILPADTVTSVIVYKLEYDSELNEAFNGAVLYTSSESKPFVVKCNFSDLFPDVNIVLTAKDGTITEFSPGLSLKDGKVVVESNEPIVDLTKY